MLLGPKSRTAYGDTKIKSEVIYAGERRYYLDLGENSRGRFLKVTSVLFCLILVCIQILWNTSYLQYVEMHLWKLQVLRDAVLF